jgi:hypothetical protein
MDMTNDKQQTAVEWFLDQLIEHRIIIVDKTTYQVKYKHEILLEQAKEMEKQQMIEFSEQVFRNRYNEVYQSLTKVATDTYNQTYGGGKQ